MITKIIKRDGREVPFNIEKITNAIYKAAQAIGGKDYNTALKLSEMVADRLDETYKGTVPTVEQVQDCVEKVLVETGHARTAKEYILYRAQRTRVREMNTRLMKVYERLTFKDETNLPRFSANGTLYRYGQEGAKQFYEMFVIDPDFVRANDSGNIYIQNAEAYGLTAQSCQIDLKQLFYNGFTSGSTEIREPTDLTSACALCALALQLNQNDQHGSQGIPNFDFVLADAVRNTYRRHLRQELGKAAELLCGIELSAKIPDLILKAERESNCTAAITAESAFWEPLYKVLCAETSADTAKKLILHARTQSYAQTDRALYQGIEAFFSALNTAPTRGGADLPDTAIQYGTDVSAEGRMVSKNILLVTERGLGKGQDIVYPTQFFKCKNRVNTRAEDPNYDLYELAARVALARSCPYFVFLDAPCNVRSYAPGRPETEAAYFTGGARVLEDRLSPESISVLGRGSLSTTYLNLPRIAIRAQKNRDVFFDELDRKLDLVFEQLSERLKLQGDKRVEDFPFLMKNGIWRGSENLESGDPIAQILRHGLLNVGLIGLSETLYSLLGEHHGLSNEAQSLGLEIVAHMRRRCDRVSEERGLNFVLTAVDCPDAAKRFLQTDRELYGELPGVTDLERYTAGFSVPKDSVLSAKEQIALEAPYHELTNGGHFTAVNPDKESALKILETMRVSGIACGAVILRNEDRTHE